MREQTFLNSSMVERTAVNRDVVGSSPTWGATGISVIIFAEWRRSRPLGQAVKTSPFHGGNSSSNLLGVIISGDIAKW